MIEIKIDLLGGGVNPWRFSCICILLCLFNLTAVSHGRITHFQYLKFALFRSFFLFRIQTLLLLSSLSYTFAFLHFFVFGHVVWIQNSLTICWLFNFLLCFQGLIFDLVFLIASLSQFLLFKYKSLQSFQWMPVNILALLEFILCTTDHWNVRCLLLCSYCN